MKTRNKSIELNDLLKGANLLVAILLVIAFVQTHGNEFVDLETIVLAIALCAQTQVALSLESRRRDPFVILLAFDMIFFFALRIVSLTFYPFSIVFDRFQFNAGNSNYALEFILIANTVLYLGFYLAGRVRISRVDSSGWTPKSPVRVIFLMAAAVIFAYFSGRNADSIPRALSFLVIFLDPAITLLMALSYFLLFRKSLSKKIAISIAALIATDAVIHTLLGSRGAILVFVQNVIIVSLAVRGGMRLSRKAVLIGFALLPAVATLLIVTFVVSTYNRTAKDMGRPLEIGRALELASESSSELSDSIDLDLILPPIAARAGYFDYSAEIIANRSEYSKVINLSSYAKSFVDNLMTPGFDVFDQPKISNALRFIYQGLGAPSKKWIDSENYQSDQLGIYGEFYGLFGYACLPLLLVVAVVFKRVYLRSTARNPFRFVLKRGIVLMIFVWTIDSFGVDWIILQSLPLIVAMYLYAPFFPSRRGIVAGVGSSSRFPSVGGDAAVSPN